jgi:hypothetical protein
MDTLKIKEDWNYLKEKIKQKFPTFFSFKEHQIVPQKTEQTQDENVLKSDIKIKKDSKSQ